MDKHVVLHVDPTGPRVGITQDRQRLLELEEDEALLLADELTMAVEHRRRAAG